MRRSIICRGFTRSHGRRAASRVWLRAISTGNSARYALTPDSEAVYLLVPEAGKENLYRVAAAGGKPLRSSSRRTGGYTALEIAQKAAKPVLIGGYGSSVSPTEIVRIDPRAAQACQSHPRQYRGGGGHRLASRRSISISPAPRAATSTI